MLTARARVTALVAWTSVQGFVAELGIHVPPGAVDIVRKADKGTASVWYYVQESYPATNTLTFIRESLEEGGWRPVTGADVDPHESSSLEDGWQEVPIKDTSARMQIWSARWFRADGSEVTYTLLYSSAHGKEGLRPTYVSVSAWYRDKVAAAREKGLRSPILRAIAESNKRLKLTSGAWQGWSAASQLIWNDCCQASRQGVVSVLFHSKGRCRSLS